MTNFIVYLVLSILFLAMFIATSSFMVKYVAIITLLLFAVWLTVDINKKVK